LQFFGSLVVVSVFFYVELEQIEGTTHFVCVVFSYYLHKIDGKYEAAAFKYGISVKNRLGECIYVFTTWRNVAAVIGLDGGVLMWFIVPMWMELA
jgi:hypothetical protein